MSNDRDNKIDETKYSTDIAASWVNNIFELIAADTAEFSPEFPRRVANLVLAGVIAQLVYRSLRAPGAPAGHPGPYSAAKFQICQSVANGFVGAFKTYNPATQVDFFCEVTKVPEPANDIPC